MNVVEVPIDLTNPVTGVQTPMGQWRDDFVYTVNRWSDGLRINDLPADRWRLVTPRT